MGLHLFVVILVGVSSFQIVIVKIKKEVDSLNYLKKEVLNHLKVRVISVYLLNFQDKIVENEDFQI